MRGRRLTVKLLWLIACCPALAADVEPSGASGGSPPRERRPALKAVFFFTPGCRLCKPTKAAVRRAEAKFGERIAVEWVDLSHPSEGTASAQRLFNMLDRYGVKETPPLALFAGETCLAGGVRIIEELDETISRELSGPGRPGPQRPPLVTNRLGFWAISAAALADGVNPCAFATVVLLVSMMAAARRTRRETLLIGCTFTVAVYATYFLIGIAFFGVLQRLQALFLVSDLVFYVAFAACVVFGVLSLYDASLGWRGKEPKQMLLKVPESLRDRMRKSMRAGVHSGSLVAGTLAAGVVVSLLESACTGQVYFPVIAGLVRDSGTRARGVALLAWYNLLFILPLLVIFGLTFTGVTSERIAAFGRRRWGVTKLLLALVFIAMALWMAPGLIWPPGAR